MLEDTVIAIVDDDASVREAIGAFVRSLGYKAVTFSSAELFLQSEVIAQTKCLITDLQMPGLSGLDLQEELRSRGYRTPIIVITAYPEKQRRARALKAGAVGFLSKPFGDEELIECLTVAMSKASAAVG